MNNNSKRIESFTNLNAWKEAHQLVLMIYKITKNFPNSKFQIPNSNKGFTFIEMIIAIAIFIIMMLATATFFSILYREQAVDIVKIEGTNIAGRALEKMGREIRKMNRAENGTFAIELADAQNFIFYSDVDNDGFTEKIEYFLNGTDLERKLTEPGISMDYSGDTVTTFIARYVRNGAEPVFSYYDKNYTGNEDPLFCPVNVTQIRMVGVYLGINFNEKYSSGFVHAEVKINPRNLKNFD